MSRGRSSKLVAVALVWVVIVVLGALAYRMIVAPRVESGRAYDEARDAYRELAEEAERRGVTPDPLPADADAATLRAMVDDLRARLTSSAAAGVAIRHRVGISLDSFSGYAVFRSASLADELAGMGIALELVDDGADYGARLRSIRSGRTPLAVFTLDALIKAAAALGESPATVVMVIDETTGADAMIAYETGLPDLAALDSPDARIVTTRDSPSETLARVVMSNFSLPKLPDEPWVDADGAADVYRRFRAADPSSPHAFVLWEPFLSQALREPGAHVLMDSSRFRGYIVDVLVVQRDYLLKHEAEVRQLVEAYHRVAHRLQREPNAWRRMIAEDAAATGETLSDDQIGRLLDGIWWKNTLENYAHFSLLPDARDGSVQPLTRSVTNLVRVLQRTGSISNDPTQGDPGRLLYDAVLRELREAGFHPGDAQSETVEAVREGAAVRALSDAQWSALVPVGTLDVSRLVFARGKAALTNRSQQTLRELADTLDHWPRYYLVVEGQARSIGDTDANRALAEQRAASAREFLIAQGVDARRVRARTGDELGRGGAAQSVTFALMQPPY